MKVQVLYLDSNLLVARQCELLEEEVHSNCLLVAAQFFASMYVRIADNSVTFPDTADL